MAEPDGYTLGMTSGSILTVLPWTMDPGFDPLKLNFVGSTHESACALWVGADSRGATIEELVEYARSDPGQLRVADSSGFGLPDIVIARLAALSRGFTYPRSRPRGGAEQLVKPLAGDVDADGLDDRVTEIMK